MEVSIHYKGKMARVIIDGVDVTRNVCDVSFSIAPNQRGHVVLALWPDELTLEADADVEGRWKLRAVNPPREGEMPR